MIPIRDTIRARRWPVVNYAVIALCAWAYWRELAAGPDLGALFDSYALTPATFVKSVARHGVFELAQWTPFVSSMFLHGGILHLAGNMLFLWIFGDNVEDRFGHVGYAVFYLGGGIVAAGAHVLATPGSTVFTVGASGAIAAVMGAYMLLYPGARIESLVIVFVFVRVISVPAFVWLGLWFVFQVVSGSADSRDSGEGGVAWFAHIGGFAFGAAVVLLLGMRGERPLRAV
jgi:membrane associated rhomboid family serine protease